MTERTVEDLLAMIARSLGATSARILAADAVDAALLRADGAGLVSLGCDLTEGKRLVVEVAASTKDAAALQRRLEMLVDTFADMFPHEKRERSVRPPPARNLHEELVALVERAHASDALVIDAHSPVVWGSATDADGAATAPDDAPRPPTQLHRARSDDAQQALQELASAQGVRVDPGAMAVVPRAVCAHHRVLPIARSGDKLVLAMSDPGDADAIRDVVLTTGLDVEPVFAGDSMAAFFNLLDGGSDGASYEDVMAALSPELRAERTPRAERARLAWAHAARAKNVIADIRAQPELDTLRKGGHLRRMVSKDDLRYLARSFAAIYVLVLIYDGPFEELLAKRAVAHALPTVERLVAALPPLDPTPLAGAVALRRKRRR